MLQAPPPTASLPTTTSTNKVYGHGHIKKLWLMQSTRQLQQQREINVQSTIASSSNNKSQNKFMAANYNDQLQKPKVISYRSSQSYASPSLVACADSLAPRAASPSFGCCSPSSAVSRGGAAADDRYCRGGSSEIRSSASYGGGEREQQQSTMDGAGRVASRPAASAAGVAAAVAVAGGASAAAHPPPPWRSGYGDNEEDVDEEEEEHRPRSPCARTCSMCGTNKTPLWRSGPRGPKSLCNACGIRFKKSRRCCSAAAAVDSFLHCRTEKAPPKSVDDDVRALKRKQQDVIRLVSSSSKRRGVGGRRSRDFFLDLDVLGTDSSSSRPQPPPASLPTTKKCKWSMPIHEQRNNAAGCLEDDGEAAPECDRASTINTANINIDYRRSGADETAATTESNRTGSDGCRDDKEKMAKGNTAEVKDVDGDNGDGSSWEMGSRATTLTRPIASRRGNNSVWHHHHHPSLQGGGVARASPQPSLYGGAGVISMMESSATSSSSSSDVKDAAVLLVYMSGGLVFA